MGRYERSIKIAFDKLSGEILDADEIFDITKEAFEIRRKYHEKNLLLSCYECDQDLMVSGSKYDRLHFKHKPGHGNCVLADGNLSPKELDKFTNILKSKESDRHKQLKNKIGELLLEVDGVDKLSIAIDSRFIIRDGEKRRPDVYCRYHEKELVFEIQLSDLSLGYILSRHDFYRKNGMYLIWILDNFDIHNQNTLERDIKYLTKYENFFKLNESAQTFNLDCEYKFPFLTPDNKLLTKWLKKSVSLSQVKFDSESYQIYYYNFGDNKSKTEAYQRTIAKDLVENDRKKADEQRFSNATLKTNNIIKEIKELRKVKSQDFNSVSIQISKLDEYELQVFNSTLGFADKLKSNISPIFKWLKTAKKDDAAFIRFILRCDVIEFDINDTDKDGKTAFQAAHENKDIYKYIPIKLLFQRGYRLTESDEIFFSEFQGHDSKDKNDKITIYKLYNKLTDKTLVESVCTHSKLLFIIESARQKEIIGFNYKPTEWIAFSNNAIQYYSKYWEYIELAFKHFGIWNILTDSDKNGTFAKKVHAFYSEMSEQDFDFDDVFRDIYPELTYLHEGS